MDGQQSDIIYSGIMSLTGWLAGWAIGDLFYAE